MKMSKVRSSAYLGAFAALALMLGACQPEQAERAEESPPRGGGVEAPSGIPVIKGLEGARGEPTDTIDMRQIGYSMGAEDAPIQVFEFSDFGCPFCGRFARETFPQIHGEFIENGSVRWTYVPVTFGFPGGVEGARAAECAAEQGKFWEMHDLLYERQQEWRESPNPESLALNYAGRVELDSERFASCYREDRGAMRQATHNRAAEALRVRATPSFFINGRLVEGALPYAEFDRVLRMLSPDQ